MKTLYTLFIAIIFAYNAKAQTKKNTASNGQNITVTIQNIKMIKEVYS